MDAAGAVLALIAAAYRLRGRRALSGATAPRRAIAGLAVCLFSIPWGALVLLAFGLAPGIPYLWTIAVSLTGAAAAFLLMRRWTSAIDWGDAHRYVAVCGAIGGSMLSSSI